MQIYPKFLVNINSYIDFITMYILLKNVVFWLINKPSSFKLNLKLKNSVGL